MARNDRADRPPGEERLDRARKTNDEAWTIIGQEREAMRKKTERLKQLRLAKEAEAGVTILDKKPSTARKTAKKSAAKTAKGGKRK
jgi:hypothetical protein